MNLENWKAQAKAHWREHRPTEYRQLQHKGLLAQALREAVELTHKEMTALEEAGHTEHEAWEMVREKYLFKPPEKAEQALDRPDLALMQETQKVLNEALALESESE